MKIHKKPKESSYNYIFKQLRNFTFSIARFDSMHGRLKKATSLARIHAKKSIPKLTKAKPFPLSFQAKK